MSPLLAKSAELALEFLEANGVLVPFCKLIDRDGAPVVITPEDEGEAAHAEASVRAELVRRLTMQGVREFAVCSDVEVKFAGESTERRCLKIEFQDGSEDTGIYFFPLTLEDGRASLGPYLVADVSERALVG